MNANIPDPTLTGWLLEAKTPSIRYLTRRLLLEAPETDAALQADRREIMHAGPVPQILAKQAENGAWLSEKSYYTPKFTSSHWSMLLLAELHANPLDERVRAGAVSVLNRLQPEMEKRLLPGAYSWECLWANALRYCAYAGLFDHPGFQEMVAVLVDSGLHHEWRCRWSGNGPCAWSAARTLLALAALPEALRTAPVAQTIECGLDFLLHQYSPVLADYPAERSGKTSDLWRKLNFPLFYQADILLILRALAELDRLDHPGAAPALEWLAACQKDGRWRGTNPFGARTWSALRDKEETDRWVSLYAGWVLIKAQFC